MPGKVSSKYVIFVEGPDNSGKTSLVKMMMPLGVLKGVEFMKEPFVEYDLNDTRSHLTVRLNVYSGISRQIISHNKKYIIDRSFMSHLVYNIFIKGKDYDYLVKIIEFYKYMLKSLELFDKMKIVVLIRESMLHKDKEYYKLAIAYMIVANELRNYGFDVEIYSFEDFNDIKYKFLIDELYNFILE